MLTKDDFLTLEPGDEVETAPPFKTLTDEPIVFRLAEKADEGRTLIFDMVLFGVNLGGATCSLTDGGPKWQLM